MTPATKQTPVDELSPHNKILVEYMRAGRTLTNQIALSQLHVGSLSSRVAQLRRHGWDVRSAFKEDFHGNRYKHYWLAEPDAAPVK